MELIDKKDLPFLPYNYKELLKVEIADNKTKVKEEIEPNYVEVKDFMTDKHMLNHYYFKPISKYFIDSEIKLS